jgi:hypothetical protein
MRLCPQPQPFAVWEEGRCGVCASVIPHCNASRCLLYKHCRHLTAYWGKTVTTVMIDDLGTASVVSWSQFLAANQKGPGSILGATAFLNKSGSGTGSIQHREDKWRAAWNKNYGLRPRKLRLTAVGVPPRWGHDTTLTAKVGTKIRRQRTTSYPRRQHYSFLSLWKYQVLHSINWLGYITGT